MLTYLSLIGMVYIALHLGACIKKRDEKPRYRVTLDRHAWAAIGVGSTYIGIDLVNAIGGAIH